MEVQNRNEHWRWGPVTGGFGGPPCLQDGMEASLSSCWFGSCPWFSPITFGGFRVLTNGESLSLHFVSITQKKKKKIMEAFCNLGSPVPVNDNIL